MEPRYKEEASREEKEQAPEAWENAVTPDVEDFFTSLEIEHSKGPAVFSWR